MCIHMERKHLWGLLILKIVCCGPIILLVIGGAGLTSGSTTRNIVLVFLGAGVLIYGGYVYFRKHGAGKSL